MDIQNTAPTSAGTFASTQILSKPTALLPKWEGIHQELKEISQWVNWKYDLNAKRNRWTKVPYQPSGTHASSTDPKTWHSFEECKTAYLHGTPSGRFDGVGFVTSPDDPYVLMDYDHVIPPDSSMSQWAIEIAEAAQREGLYGEISASGTGLHIIGRGPQGFRGRKANDAELYCKGRHFTVTGHSTALPKTIGAASESLELTLRRMAVSMQDLADGKSAEDSVEPTNAEDHSAAAADVPSAKFDDATVLNLARTARNGEKFRALFDDGDVTAFDGDDSRADMALASLLAFWVGPDSARIAALMRSSALVRDKWDNHKTYLAITISKVISGMTPKDFYDWSRHGAVGTVTNPALQQILAGVSSNSGASGQTAGRRAALQTNRAGEILASVNNVIVLLESDPDLQGVVRYNEFANLLEIHKPVPGKTGEPDTRTYMRRWADADSIALQAYLQRTSIPKVSRDIVDDALLHYAQDNCYHPVREYLCSLVWDQKGRLDNWLDEYCNADAAIPPTYLEAVGSKFLISAVARVMRPGCKADHVLVLEGDQGIGKSTALAILAGPDWFTDSLPNDLGNKDAAIHLRGRLIVEMSELSQFTRSQIETIKSYFTRQTDIYRPPFGRHDIEVPRQCVFAGSTNSDGYLIDTTGNRRFWPVKVGFIDTVALQRDRDQIWAEAYERFQLGEAWHMTERDVIDMQVEQACNRVVTDPWREDVMKVLQQHRTGGITPGEVLTKMDDLKPSDRHKGNAARVSGILRDLGWRQGKRHHSRGQVYLPPTELDQLDLFGPKPR